MKNKLLILFTFFLTYNLHAQIPGTLDLNFANEGTLLESTQKGYFPYDISIQKNSGEIFIAGVDNAGIANGAYGVVKRLDFYGNPVTSFGTNGELTIAFPEGKNQVIYQIRPDNANLGTTGFYIRGQYKDLISNKIINYISKHNADGSLDTSYGNSGKILMLGQFSGNYIYSLDLNSVTGHQYLKRYDLQTGLLDQTFANAELPIPDNQVHFLNGQYSHLNIQKDGKIVLVGKKTINEFTRYGVLARFNANGTIDTTFGNAGYYYSPLQDYTPIESITQSDNKIIYTDGNANFFRLNPNGTTDTTYGVNGIANINGFGCDYYASAFSMRIQSDDKIYFGGIVLSNDCTGGQNYSQYIARLNANGIFDFVKKSFDMNYSEIWSSALIDESFILTSGVNSPSNLIWERVVQRVYTKAPVFSLYGTATGTADIDLSTTDQKIFTGTVNLSAGALKFRLNHNNDYNWGGTNFPSGQSTMGKEEIQIISSGTYDVIFNLKNGAYTFSTVLKTKDIDANSIKIYPNPTKDMITFSEKVSNVLVYDQSGKVIYVNDKNTDTIDLSNFSSGLYKVTFKNRNGSVQIKNVIKK